MSEPKKCPTCKFSMVLQHRIGEDPELICLTCRGTKKKKKPDLTDEDPARVTLTEVRAVLFGFGQVTSSNVRELLALLEDAGHADARVEMHPDGVRVVKLAHSEPDCQTASIEVEASNTPRDSRTKGVISIGNQRCRVCNGTGHRGQG